MLVIVNIQSMIKSLRFGSGRYVFDNKKTKMFENVIIPTWYTTGDGNEKYVVIGFGKVMFDSDTFELMEMSADEEIIDNWSKESMIRKAIKQLEPREKAIILDRYFKNKTQTEIALELGISQAQVSRLEKNALKSMYENMK